MLLATFGPSSAWAGKTIIYEDGTFILEGHGAITAGDVLSYDRQGQIEWAYAGLCEWVEQTAQTTSATALGGQAASPLSQPQPARPESGVGVAGFVLSLVGFLIPLLWIVGLVLSLRDIKRAKREDLPRGLALAGLIISSIGVSLLIVGLVAAMAIPMFLNQRDKANESSVKEAIHSIQIGVQSWAVDHDDVYPESSELSQQGLASYLDHWPVNPYTGLPMTQGSSPGDFSYVVTPDGTAFQLTGYGRNGQGVITVP